MKYAIETRIVGSVISQDLFVDFGSESHLMAHWLVDTREKQFRDALIKMGWTPPLDNEPMDYIQNPQKDND